MDERQRPFPALAETRLQRKAQVVIVEFLRSKKKLIIVFLIALAVRLSAALFRYFYGYHFDQQLETYYDFNAYYLFWVNQFLSGHQPYSQFAYTYPPGFLFLLTAFYIVGAPQLLMMLADAVTACAVYEIAKRWDEKAGFVAGLCYALLPTALIYEGYVWMSTQPFLMFLMLSLIDALNGKSMRAGIWYGLSLLIKQQALLFAPVVIAAVWGKRGNIIKTLSLAFVIFAVPSSFFLISATQGFLYAVTLGIFGSRPANLTLPPGVMIWTFISSPTTPICSPQNNFTSLCTNARGYIYTVISVRPNMLMMWTYTFMIPMALLAVSLPVLSMVTMKKGRVDALMLAVAVSALIHTIGIFLGFELPYRYYFVPFSALTLALSRSEFGSVLIYEIYTSSLILPIGIMQDVVMSVSIVVVAIRELLHGQTRSPTTRSAGLVR